MGLTRSRRLGKPEILPANGKQKGDFARRRRGAEGGKKPQIGQ